jgi:hypothetical protein
MDERREDRAKGDDWGKENGCSGYDRQEGKGGYSIELNECPQKWDAAPYTGSGPPDGGATGRGMEGLESPRAAM